MKDLQISFENDGHFTDKDIGYSVTFTGVLNGEQMKSKPIGKITSVTPDTVFAVIFQEYADSYLSLGKPSVPVTYSFSKEAWNKHAERVKDCNFGGG